MSSLADLIEMLRRDEARLVAQIEAQQRPGWDDHARIENSLTKVRNEIAAIRGMLEMPDLS